MTAAVCPLTDLSSCSWLHALIDLVSVLDSVLLLQLLWDVWKPAEQPDESALSTRTLLTPCPREAADEADRVGNLLGQLPVSVSLDFREESVAVKLLQDARDKQSPGSWCLHHLLGHR